MRGALSWALGSLLAVGVWMPTLAAETRAGGDPVVATIDGEPVHLDELMVQFAFVHRAGIQPERETGIEDVEAPERPRVEAILERLINVRLVVLEARAIGLDALPEIREKVEAHRTEALRSLLFEEFEGAIRQGDADEIEALYRDAVREFEVRGLITTDAAVAEEVSRALREGRPFDEVAAEAVDGGQAAVEHRRFLPVREIRPEIARAILAMEDGTWSEPVRFGPRYAIFERLGERFPDDPQARGEAEEEGLRRKRGRELRKFFLDLIEKRAEIDDELLDALDLDAKEPGVEALKKDRRVVAALENGGDVTVADMMEVATKSYFHGTEQAVQEKRMNSRKREFLQAVLIRRLTIAEAERRKLDQTDRFRREMERFEEGLLFSTFASRVIDPEIHIERESLEAHYETRRDEYKTGEQVALEALTFTSREEAQEAIAKLRRGADLDWVRENASGAIEAPAGSLVEGLSGNLLPKHVLAEAVRTAIEGATEGDYRIAGDDPGPYHVLHVLRVVPERVLPYEEVAEAVARSWIVAERERILRDWGAKLREAYDVQVKVRGEDLDRMVLERVAEGS